MTWGGCDHALAIPTRSMARLLAALVIMGDDGAQPRGRAGRYLVPPACSSRCFFMRRQCAYRARSRSGRRQTRPTLLALQLVLNIVSAGCSCDCPAVRFANAGVSWSVKGVLPALLPLGIALACLRKAAGHLRRLAGEVRRDQPAHAQHTVLHCSADRLTMIVHLRPAFSDPAMSDGVKIGVLMASVAAVSAIRCPIHGIGTKA